MITPPDGGHRQRIVEGRRSLRNLKRTSSEEVNRCRVALIRLCQDAGFTLAEVRVFVEAGSRRNPLRTQLMKAKLHELEASIDRATRAKALIEHGLTCRHRELSACPNFRSALAARL